MNPERIFYVYAHYRKSDGRLFYIGKGKGNRYRTKSGRSDYWRRIEAKHGRTARKILSDIPEPCAFSLERALIAQNKNLLCNMTDGGEGASGLTRSIEWRKMMSERVSGAGNPMFGNDKPLSEDHKRKIGISNKKPKPTGFGDAVSKRMKGTIQTDERKEKIRLTMAGRHKGRRNPMHGKTGKQCPRYDVQVYVIHHPDFGKLKGRQSNLSAILGSGLYRALNGKRKHYKGWMPA